MRLELGGTLYIPEPRVLTYPADDSFIPADWIDLGYTNFDVLCIGGGGGAGGGIDTANTGTLVRSYGGAGGGGGAHRVKGLLSGLPSSCPIVIGLGGGKGSDHASDPAQTTNGADGGYSRFNTTTCRASGGKGGLRVQVNSLTTGTSADGGRGGSGDSITAGGGGLGGTAGIPTATGPGTPGTDAADGTWDGTIGYGGGGGGGGVGKYTGVSCNAATRGGRGAYNASDVSLYAPGGYPSDDVTAVADSIIPGQGGGAKASALSNVYAAYGSGGAASAGSDGVVVIRLTVV